MIPYGRQNIDDDDVAAVVAVLRSEFVTQGPAVSAFEKAVLTHCGGRYGVAVNSATSALHLACLALGLGPGDGAWTTPISFVASANCVLYCGATVDFVDVDPATANMSMDRLEEKLVAAERDGTLPKVVIVVHMCGQPADMARVGELASRYGFRVVEDASHAIGASYCGQQVGSGRYSDITVFSFHPVKIITTGEGGMAVTNDPLLAEAMRRLRSHGITRESSELRVAGEGPWYYEQQSLGFNYRMTDIQAALGSSQMRKLTSLVAARTCLAARYDELLADLPVRPLARANDRSSAWHLYVVSVERRRKVFERLRAAGIGVNVHYIPIYRQPYYEAMGFQPEKFPGAESYYAGALTLPLFPQLTERQQEQVVVALAEAIR